VIKTSGKNGKADPCRQIKDGMQRFIRIGKNRNIFPGSSFSPLTMP
jgi:hypothetical protein